MESLSPHIRFKDSNGLVITFNIDTVSNGSSYKRLAPHQWPGAVSSELPGSGRCTTTKRLLGSSDSNTALVLRIKHDLELEQGQRQGAGKAHVMTVGQILWASLTERCTTFFSALTCMSGRSLRWWSSERWCFQSVAGNSRNYFPQFYHLFFPSSGEGPQFTHYMRYGTSMICVRSFWYNGCTYMGRRKELQAFLWVFCGASSFLTGCMDLRFT